MKPDIDTIVEDILRDNPELVPEAEALRVLVSELAAKQPHITVDEAFKARLRAKLVSGAVVAPATKRSVLPWWLIYTVPVGVTALMLLVIQPPYATAPVMPTDIETTETSDTAESIETGSFDAAPAMMYMETEPAMKGSGGDTARSFETGVAEDTMLIEAPAGNSDYFTAELTPDRQAVRLVHLSVANPAFVSIGGPQGEVVVSGLFLPGEHVNVLLPVKGGVVRGGTYTAILYYDNGDGRYTEGFEVMALDASGTPISMTLVAP